MKRQMKWAAASLICSLIIQCMPAAADQKTQEAFDAYLDRIYAQWISENPFQIHFYLEHPENYGIELSSYTLMDYSEYDEAAIEAYEKQQEEDLKELRSFDKTQLTRQQQILYDKLMEQIDLNEKYADMFDFSSLIGGSNGIVNSLANNFQNYLFIEKKDVEEYLKFLQDIPNYIDALFETMSGFTTTGASIVPDITQLAHSSLFWRSFTHWIGGMGILVFILIFIPESEDGSSLHLLKAESPGPQVGKLASKMKMTTRILYLIYLGLTIIEVILLLFSPKQVCLLYTSPSPRD